MPNETISASHTSAARFSTGPLGRVLNTSPVAVLQCGLGLAMAVAFVAFSVAARFTVPYRDDWDWLLSLLSQPMTVRSLFAPHNEHIIPLARLLHAAQYKLEGSQGILLFSVAVMAQLSTGCVFCGETAARWTGRTRLFVIGVVCTLLFSTFQLQSIVFPAAILFPLVQCFAVIAFTAVLTADLRPRPRRLRTCAAALATVAAILTTTNGFAVPVIVAALAWREGRRRTAFGFGVVALACAIGYAILVGAPWHDGPPAAGQQWALRSAGTMAAYLLTFYGSALAYASIPAAIAVGTGLFGLGCFATWRTIVAGPNAPVSSGSAWRPSPLLSRATRWRPWAGRRSSDRYRPPVALRDVRVRVLRRADSVAVQLQRTSPEPAAACLDCLGDRGGVGGADSRQYLRRRGLGGKGGQHCRRGYDACLGSER